MIVTRPAPLRRATRLAALCAAVALSWGCATTSTGAPVPPGIGVTSSAPSAASSAPAAAPSTAPTESPSTGPKPTASPTPRNWASDPKAAEAGRRFVAAADRVNAALDAAYRTYPVFNVRDLDAGHAYLRLAAAAEGEFVAAVRGITFPDGMGPDVARLLDAEAALIALETRGTKVADLAKLDAVLREFVSVSKAAADASSVVRRDLGLPVAAP